MCHLSELPHPQYFTFWSLLKKTSLKIICAYYLEIKKRVSDTIYPAMCKNLSDGFKLLAFWVLASVDKLVVKDLHKVLRRYTNQLNIFLFELFTWGYPIFGVNFSSVSWNHILFFIIIESHSTHHSNHVQDVFVKDEYHFLNVRGIGTFTVYDAFDCTFECLSNPSCLSLNLAASKGADGKLWCELLTSNKDINPDEFKENMTSHHFALKVRK